MLKSAFPGHPAGTVGARASVGARRGSARTPLAARARPPSPESRWRRFGFIFSPHYDTYLHYASIRYSQAQAVFDRPDPIAGHGELGMAGVTQPYDDAAAEVRCDLLQ